MTWTPDAGALGLLERAGNPFALRAYRQGFVVGYPKWRDASFGAVADDGTRAAVALLAIQRQAESVPLGYGGIVSDRPLEEVEARSFLEAARQAVGVRMLRVRSLPEVGVDGPGSRVMDTSVLTPTDVESGFHDQARRSLRKAETAGCEVRPANVERFLALYAHERRGEPYSEHMIRALGGSGLAHAYDVTLGGAPVAAILTLRGEGHWVYWLGTQIDAGREAAASYLALRAFLRDAQEAGVAKVNLGASVVGREVLEGVVRFKRSLGAEEVPLIQETVSSSRWRRTGRRRTDRP